MNRFAPPHLAALFLVFANLAFLQAHAEQDELLHLINQYRAGGQNCAGREVAPSKPLRRNAALDVAARAAMKGGLLAKHLQRAGYRANNAQWLSVSGTSSERRTMVLLAQRFCGQLMRPSYSEIGIYREGTEWSIVLAAPAAALGDSKAAVRKVLASTNDARSQPRLCGQKAYTKAAPLKWNEKLAAAAAKHSEDMASKNYFSHIAKDGGTPGERVTSEDYRYRIVSENIAAGQSDPREVVTGWLKSPGHCANLMNPNVTEMGAGLNADPKSEFGVYWTQVFAAPR